MTLLAHIAANPGTTAAEAAAALGLPPVTAWRHATDLRGAGLVDGYRADQFRLRLVLAEGAAGLAARHCPKCGGYAIDCHHRLGLAERGERP